MARRPWFRHSEVTKEKIRQSKLGRRLSYETRLKISRSKANGSVDAAAKVASPVERVVSHFDSNPNLTCAEIAAQLRLHPEYVRTALTRTGRSARKTNRWEQRQ